MRLGIIILAFLGLSITANAGSKDFIEGQMKYQVLENGKKDFSYTWNENEQILVVRMGLNWDHFQASSHGVGFDLNNSYSSDLIFPHETMNCRFQKSFGQIPGSVDLNNNEVFIQFKGSNCREDIIYQFNLAAVAIHFYNVPHWNSNGDVTGVFRLQIYEGAGH